MFNDQQRDNLSKFAFKIAEIFLAGCVVTGFMHDDVKPILGKIIFGLAVIPGFIIIGLVLDSGDDEPP